LPPPCPSEQREKKKQKKKKKSFVASLFLHQIVTSYNKTKKNITYSIMLSFIAIVKHKHLLKAKVFSHFFIRLTSPAPPHHSLETFSPNSPLFPPTPSSQSSLPHLSPQQSDSKTTET
jgi:hypothetical protein